MSNGGLGQAQLLKSQTEVVCFKKGDIVWAKVRGYSWWPAKVGEVYPPNKKGDKERKYHVQFIGDNTHQQLPQNKVADFIENYQKFSLTKKKVLQDSIEAAKKCLKKEDLNLLNQRALSGEQVKKTSEKGAISEKDDVCKIEFNIAQLLIKQSKNSVNGHQQQSDNKNSASRSQSPPSKNCINQNESNNHQTSSSKRVAESEKSNFVDQEEGAVNKGKKRVLKAKSKKVVSKVSATLKLQSQKDKELIEVTISEESEDEEKQIINTQSKNLKGGLGKRVKRKFSDESLETANNEGKIQEGKQSPDKGHRGLALSGNGENSIGLGEDTKQINKKSEEFKEEENRKEIQNTKSKEIMPISHGPQDEDLSDEGDENPEESEEEEKSPKRKRTDSNKLSAQERAILSTSSDQLKKRKAKCNAEQFIKQAVSSKGLCMEINKEDNGTSSTGQGVHSTKNSHAKSHVQQTHQLQQKQSEKNLKLQANNNNNSNNHHDTPGHVHQPSLIKESSLGHTTSNQNGNQPTSLGKDLASIQPQNNPKNSKQNQLNPMPQQSSGQGQKRSQDEVMMNKFKKIQNFFLNLIQKQQKKEEKLYDQSLHDSQSIEELRSESLNIVRDNIKQIKEYLMYVFKSQITYEILNTTKIGIVMGQFKDFCKNYKHILTDLERIESESGFILLKWKNFINNSLFDDNKEYQFQINKHDKKQEKHNQKKQKSSSKFHRSPHSGNLGPSTFQAEVQSTTHKISGVSGDINFQHSSRFTILTQAVQHLEDIQGDDTSKAYQGQGLETSRSLPFLSFTNRMERTNSGIKQEESKNIRKTQDDGTEEMVLESTEHIIQQNSSNSSDFSPIQIGQSKSLSPKRIVSSFQIPPPELVQENSSPIRKENLGKASLPSGSLDNQAQRSSLQPDNIIYKNLQISYNEDGQADNREPRDASRQENQMVIDEERRDTECATEYNKDQDSNGKSFKNNTNEEDEDVGNRTLVQEEGNISEA